MEHPHSKKKRRPKCPPLLPPTQNPFLSDHTHIYGPVILSLSLFPSSAVRQMRFFPDVTKGKNLFFSLNSVHWKMRTSLQNFFFEGGAFVEKFFSRHVKRNKVRRSTTFRAPFTDVRTVHCNPEKRISTLLCMLRCLQRKSI